MIIKTCAEILQVTIVLVTSNESVPWLLFVPDQFSSEESVFVAFHFYGAGHYDSTRNTEEGKPSHNTKANSSCAGWPASKLYMYLNKSTYIRKCNFA